MKMLILAAVVMMSASVHANEIRVCGVKLSSYKNSQFTFQNIYFLEGRNDYVACNRAIKLCNKIGKARDNSFDELHQCEVVYKESSFDSEKIEKLFAELVKN